MDTNLALVLLVTPLLGFFKCFLWKNLGKSLSGTIGTLTVAIFL